VTADSNTAALEVVSTLAKALDADDFGRVEACLHPEVTYRINGATPRGPSAVVKSYRTGSELARSIFDHVEFEHDIVGFVERDTIRVDFSDLLEANGESFEHHSVQDITVDPSGTVLSIVDQPVAGQHTRLDEFMNRHGLGR
jgi:hypothetical protein